VKPFRQGKVFSRWGGGRKAAPYLEQRGGAKLQKMKIILMLETKKAQLCKRGGGEKKKRSAISPSNALEYEQKGKAGCRFLSAADSSNKVQRAFSPLGEEKELKSPPPLPLGQTSEKGREKKATEENRKRGSGHPV